MSMSVSMVIYAGTSAFLRQEGLLSPGLSASESRYASVSLFAHSSEKVTGNTSTCISRARSAQRRVLLAVPSPYPDDGQVGQERPNDDPGRPALRGSR